jgi:hypothetical protein
MLQTELLQEDLRVNYSQPPTYPAFLITIDTESDNLWSRPRKVTMKNAVYLPRFQDLCERYGMRPTYLTDWDMVHSPAFTEFAKDVLRREAGEIGMHLHAWNTPPIVPITEDDDWYHPYLIEYPENHIRNKVDALTTTLEDTFGVKMVSHRAGRWSFDHIYARVLVDNGYRVDCSVTPHVSWKSVLGAPCRGGGTDFSSYPEAAYFLDLDDIARHGHSPMLEVPVSIISKERPTIIEMADKLLARRSDIIGSLVKRVPTCIWLRPNGDNRGDMLKVLSAAWSSGRDYVEFMLHSSELMPGGSPTFPTESSVEHLYADIEALFASAHQQFVGQTLAEYYHSFAAKHLRSGRTVSRPA